jgi:hypothetical protein
MKMKDLKAKLLSCKGFVNNIYLEKYCSLVERHTTTGVQRRQTNAHHIIPKAWFKLNKLPIDNSECNLVNLPYREHALAHYYLCLCTLDQLQYANELAFICLISRKKLNFSDKHLITHLPLYNNIVESYKYRQKTNYKLY